jgi:hypothetical protein
VGHPPQAARLADRLAGADARRRGEGLPVRCLGPRRAAPHRQLRRARLQPDRDWLALQPPVAPGMAELRSPGRSA